MLTTPMPTMSMSSTTTMDREMTGFIGFSALSLISLSLNGLDVDVLGSGVTSLS